jgi:transcriptional regulator of acetoin/glycerol metabolism
VRLPPLRERREEILALFGVLHARAANGASSMLDVDAAERLCLHDWPYNVRELASLARRIAVLHRAPKAITVEHLSAELQAADDVDPNRGARPVDLKRLRGALRANQGNVSRAAAALGISRQRAYRLMADDPGDSG